MSLGFPRTLHLDAAVLAAVLAVGCVGATTPAPAQSTTTLSAAEIGAAAPDRDASLSRAQRRLEVAAREIGVLHRELSRHPPEAARPTREILRRAEQKRAELEHELARLGATPAGSWSPERRDALDARLDELDELLEQARR